MTDDTSSTQDDNNPDTNDESPPVKYRLPEVKDFDGVNHNFETLGDLITTIVFEIKEHSEKTNQNMLILAKETNANFSKLADDMKSILSTQTMVVAICIIFICFTVVAVKGVVESISTFVL